MSKIISIVIILVLIGGGVYIVSNDSGSRDAAVNVPVEQVATTTVMATSSPVSVPAVTNVNATSTKPASVKVATSTKTYSAAEVSMHAGAASCWSSINGKVYDLTSWIGKHPGGDKAILSICGKDGSTAFNGQHGDQDGPMKGLPNFYIGDLK